MSIIVLMLNILTYFKFILLCIVMFIVVNFYVCYVFMYANPHVFIFQFHVLSHLVQLQGIPLEMRTAAAPDTKIINRL